MPRASAGAGAAIAVAATAPTVARTANVFFISMMSSNQKGRSINAWGVRWLQKRPVFRKDWNPAPAGSLWVKRDTNMASWLELILNIIGYGGFITVASLHRPSLSEDSSLEIGNESHGAMR
jgi:hypothetical protein